MNPSAGLHHGTKDLASVQVADSFFSSVGDAHGTLQLLNQDNRHSGADQALYAVMSLGVMNLLLLLLKSLAKLSLTSVEVTACSALLKIRPDNYVSYLNVDL